MGGDFRLLYLKSTEPGKLTLDGSSSSCDSKEISSSASSPDSNSPEIFSYQTILSQVKMDLMHSDPRIRMLAIQYLEKSNTSITIPLLQGMLSDHDPGVKVKVISSLTKFRNSLLFPLIKKFLKDSDPRVRIAALRGMFQLGERIDMNILLQFLSDESSQVRRKMATLLGWNQMEGVLPILIEMSKDRDSKVRKAALFSLVTLYPEESEDRLVEAMTDSNPDLRNWIRRILEKRIKKPLKGRGEFHANRC